MSVIDDCIRSVLAQQGDIAFEILVHDDASNDDSARYIRNRYPDVELIESTENVGFCVANNRMAAAARGRYLLLLNNDAALFPDALETLLAEADQSAILSLPQYDATTSKLIDIGCLLDPFCNPVPNLKPDRNDVAMVIGACMWIPKALWNELNGFPEWFGSIGEDLYLCCRARLAGYRVRALGSSGYRHHVGHSFGGGKISNAELTTTFGRRALSERNKTYVLTVSYPTPVLIVALPSHLLLLLLEGMLLTLLRMDYRYLLRIYFPACIALFRQHRDVLATRSAVQRNRRLPGTEFFSAFDRIPYKLRVLILYGLPNVK